MKSKNIVSGQGAGVRCVWVIVTGLLVGAASCGPEGTSSSSEVRPALQTRADSLAMQIYEYAGGPEAWHSVDYLRFDFAAEQNGQHQPARRHLWNRQSGDYRMEWPADSGTYTALFNVNNPDEGQVFLDGNAVATAQSDSLLQTAYRSFVNDTYWLLAPSKVLDPGVQRSVAADSSTDEAKVLHLAFADSVGMTPDDRYWLYADRETGRLNRWRFKLQSGNEGYFRWTGYRQFKAPAGSVRVATRKEAVGSPVAILTDNVRLPRNVPDSLFTSPHPLLQQSGSV